MKGDESENWDWQKKRKGGGTRREELQKKCEEDEKKKGKLRIYKKKAQEDTKGKREEGKMSQDEEEAQEHTVLFVKCQSITGSARCSVYSSYLPWQSRQFVFAQTADQEANIKRLLTPSKCLNKHVSASNACQLSGVGGSAARTVECSGELLLLREPNSFFFLSLMSWLLWW